MNAVTSSELTTNLQSLLARVADGERIQILEHGQPVAILVPVMDESEPALRDIGREMLAYRDQVQRHLGMKGREDIHESHQY